jgi:hypothetical protein
LACGNNNVTRDYLSSQPSGQGARKGIADRLAAGPRRKTEAFPEYRSVRMTPGQVKASAERRIKAAEAGTPSKQYPLAHDAEKKAQYYSKTDHHQPKADAWLIGEYVAPKGGLTFGRAHVHVFHDERNDEVRLHISFGEGESRHSEKIALVGATGREVNAAVDLLTEELRGMRR